jgi:hypothetical protein
VNIIMGQLAAKGCYCFKDEVDAILAKYGPEIIKFVVCKEGETEIESKFSGIKSQVDSFLQGKVSEIGALSNEPIAYVDTLVAGAKAKLNSAVPGGVGFIESAKGQKVEAMLGVDSIKTQMQSLASSAQSQVLEKSSGVMSVVEKAKVDVVSELKSSRPVVPVYDELPTFIQDALYKEVKETAKD